MPWAIANAVVQEAEAQRGRDRDRRDPGPRPRAHDRQRLARGRRHRARVRQALRLAMADPDQAVEDGIEQLIAREHELRSHAEGRGLSEEEQAEQRALEVRLDQLWDLLRRRRALRDAGEDPEQAASGPRTSSSTTSSDEPQAGAATGARSRTASAGAATSWPPAQSAQLTSRRGRAHEREPEDAAEADERGADRHAGVERVTGGRLGGLRDARAPPRAAGPRRRRAPACASWPRCTTACPRGRERGDVEPLVQRAGELGRDHGAERGDAEQPRRAGDRVVDRRRRSRRAPRRRRRAPSRSAARRSPTARPRTAAAPAAARSA